MYWREESITTRIETLKNEIKYQIFCIIEEKNPLQQGLKPSDDYYAYQLNHIEEKNPLQQGLKRQAVAFYDGATWIEEKNPLQQGLKLTANMSDMSCIFIEEKNPLQQGLKPVYVYPIVCQNVVELKRRIHYNKDWNCIIV